MNALLPAPVELPDSKLFPMASAGTSVPRNSNCIPLCDTGPWTSNLSFYIQFGNKLSSIKIETHEHNSTTFPPNAPLESTKNFWSMDIL